MIFLSKDTFPYRETARAAHDLAALLKRVKPEVESDVTLLQRAVTNAHRRMDCNLSSPEIASAWCEMNAAYQTLRVLRHKNKNKA